MKLWKNLRSPKIGRVEFCDGSGAVITPAQRSREIREHTRDDIARRVGRY